MFAFDKKTSRAIYKVLFCLICFGLSENAVAQTIAINGTTPGRAFDGVGGVSGGGGTSTLLLSYPEPYRSQIMDYLFKPNFGASMTTHFCEVGGDCNSTQGSEPSHMHSKTDENYQRGYEWFIMKEAYKRNPNITFDAVAWGCPGWIGANNTGGFWSADMRDYYIKWIKGLKSTYGITLDAIGCRNESGSNTDWLIQFHNALNTAGLSKVKIHGMDDWNGVQAKWGTADELTTKAGLKDAIDVLSAHTTWNSQWSETKVDATANAKNSGKPLWDTEEHYMNQNLGFDQATAEVNAFNLNYIQSRVTKTLFWYLVTGTYQVSPYADNSIGQMFQPWSGKYVIKPGLWGYAHYNQFVKLGWNYLDGACVNLTGGGTCVALMSPDKSDFSVIIETKGVSASKNLTFAISGGLPTSKPLCVWKSTAADQFIKQADITPTNGSFSLSIDANAIYSISTTTGQQKGSFAATPTDAAFPFPYYENYDHYKTANGEDQKAFGYLPYYQYDICGVFEITNRPDGNGKCLRQVLNTKANGWAPEWAPYSIIGDRTWKDYEVSVDVSFDVTTGYAAVMGRINDVGGGYGAYPKGYYLKLSPSGVWTLYWATGAASTGSSLASGTATLSTAQWHNLKLQFSGTTIKGFVEGKEVCSVTNSNGGNGMVGIGTGSVNDIRNSALFDNLIINTVGGATPTPTVFVQDATPPYAEGTATTVQEKHVSSVNVAPMSFKAIGSQFVIPKEFVGKPLLATVYNVNGKILKKVITKDGVIDLRSKSGISSDVKIVKLKMVN